MRCYLFGVFFSAFTDHDCLQPIRKIGETKPCIPRWWYFSLLKTSAYRIVVAEALLRPTFCPDCPFLPLKGCCALSDPDGIDVYPIGNSGLVPSSRPIRGIGFGGLLFDADRCRVLYLFLYHARRRGWGTGEWTGDTKEWKCFVRSSRVYPPLLLPKARLYPRIRTAAFFLLFMYFLER